MSKAVIFPEPGYLGGKFSQVLPNLRSNAGWEIGNIELMRQLREAGYSVDVWPCKVDKEHDIGLAIDHPLYDCDIPDKSMCVNLEPPVVRPRFFARFHGWPYKRILTHARPYVDERKAFYSPFPCIKYEGPLAPEKQAHPEICAISSGDKTFDHPEAQYKNRRQAYLAFQKDIDVYGWGWHTDTELISKCNYLGPVDNKVFTLSRYKYALVFENQILEGYCTEKWWDCIQAGTEAIYRGWKPDYPIEDALPEKWAANIVKHLGEI